MFSDYDRWKLRSPDDELYRGLPWRDEEPEFECSACFDIGWIEEDDEHVCACTECSAEVDWDEFFALAPHKEEAA